MEGQGAMISTILSLVAFLSVLVFLYRCRGSSRRSKTAVGYRRVRQKKEEEGRVNVLVTGAEGALASHVVERLIKDGGYNVHFLDLRIPKEEQRNHDVCSFFFFFFFFFYESLCCKYSKDTQNSRVIANINVSNYTNNNGVILYLNIDKDSQVAVTSDKLFHHNNILGRNENLNELVRA